MENKEFYIDHDGIALHAKLDFPGKESASGKYPLVIVVHGFTGHMEETHIAGLASALNDAGFASLRVEMYGHGKSGGDFRTHTVAKWVSELLTVIDYASGLDFVTNLYMAGHSQGGLATILAAGMNSDRLKAVVPLSPAVSIQTDSLRGTTLGAQYDPQHIPDEVVFPDGKVLSGDYFRIAQMLPVSEAIKRYKGPVLLVHGDEDEAVPLQASLDIEGEFANARLKIIRGDDHCYNYHLDMVLAETTKFLLACEAGEI